MINVNEARMHLFEGNPLLAEADKKFCEEWDPQEMPVNLWIEFAHALVEAWGTIPAPTKCTIFNTMETLLVLGDDLVQAAVATGFLESLLNSVLEGVLEREETEGLLGTESLRYFQEWDHFSYNMDANPLPTLAKGYSSEAEYARSRIEIIERWLQENPSARATDRATAERMLLELRQKEPTDRGYRTTTPNKPEAQIGNHSTAAAVRKELLTCGPIRGKIHFQKAQEYVNKLTDWLRNNPTARPGDRAAAENVLQDMRDALEGR